MYKCIVLMRPKRNSAIKVFRPFVFCLVCVFHVECNECLFVCVLWCAWHLLYRNTGVTHHIALCCFLFFYLESPWFISGLKFTGQKLRGTCPGASVGSRVCVRKSCVSANTEDMRTVQRFARSLTPSVSP